MKTGMFLWHGVLVGIGRRICARKVFPGPYTVGMICLAAALMAGSAAATDGKPRVEVEEVVTDWLSADNDSGPLWAIGAPLVVRNGQDVYVSMMETGKDIPPFCNTRWQLWRRGEAGWSVVQSGQRFNEREPCPLVLLGGRPWLSVNPHNAEGGSGPCDPHMLIFDPADPNKPPKFSRPSWSANPPFTQHSYRGLAADAASGHLVMLNIHQNRYYGSLADASGKWQALAPLTFPIRVGYPQVAIKDRAMHLLAISNIDEPVQQWRECKFGGAEPRWAPVFRRLFYSWSNNVINLPMSAAMEIDSAEDTCGVIINCDLLAESGGRARLLYVRKDYTDARVREKFFPDCQPRGQLIETQVSNCKVTRRTVLIDSQASVGMGAIAGMKFRPEFARYHVTEDGQTHVLCYGMADGETGRMIVFMLDGSGKMSDPIAMDIKTPMSVFFTNTVRGGSAASNIVDLVGAAGGELKLRYARIRLVGPE